MRDDSSADEPLRLTNADAMRALAHPVRLALIEVLTLHGPATATEAGELIDETATTCSFHLRRLARYGLIEEAGGGRGRARPWRVRHIGWETSPDIDDLQGQVASDALSLAALRRQVARHEASLPLRQGEPEPWNTVGRQMETVWWVTLEEYCQLEAELDSLVDRFRNRLRNPATRPAGARPVEFSSFMHLFDVLERYDERDTTTNDGDPNG